MERAAFKMVKANPLGHQCVSVADESAIGRGIDTEPPLSEQEGEDVVAMPKNQKIERSSHRVLVFLLRERWFGVDAGEDLFHGDLDAGNDLF
jgi:hypothetical protein